MQEVATVMVAVIAVFLGRVWLLRPAPETRTPTTTDDKIVLRNLLEKGFDATFLREMIGFAAQRLMEPEVGEVKHMECAGEVHCGGNSQSLAPFSAWFAHRPVGGVQGRAGALASARRAVRQPALFCSCCCQKRSISWRRWL